MLTLTKKMDYTLIALLHLAGQKREVISAREIARNSGVPLPILTNILKVLASAGIVFSTRGASGGYGLARETDAVTLHELITLIEGPFQFVQCAVGAPAHGNGSCELETSCPIRRPAYRIHDRLKGFLERVSLAEIIEDQPHTPRAEKQGASPAAKQDSFTEYPS